MLKYLIGLTLVAFSSSAPGIVGDFHVVSLFQHSPVTSFFAAQNRDVDIDDPEFLQYVANHWSKFDAESWIINKVLFFNQSGDQLDNCTTFMTGQKPYYVSQRMFPDTKEELKKKWPSVKPNVLDEEVWAREFNTSGSCFSMLNLPFFEMSLQILDGTNVGTMLKDRKLHPGRSYKLNRIVKTIQSEVVGRFYVKCLQPENSEKQYLLEVNICFGRNYFMTYDCFAHEDGSTGHDCNPKKDIIYPGLPATYL